MAWVLQADHLVVNWTNLTRYEVMRPSDPSSTYFFTSKDPATQGQQAFGTATVSSRTDKPASNLLITGPDQAPASLVGRSPSVDVGLNENQSWYAGSEVTPTVTDPSGPPVRIVFEVPANMVQARLVEASMRFEGNLSILIWEANITLQTGNSTASFESGTKDRPFSPTGPTPIVRERVYRLLRLDAKNASLTLQVNQGPLLIASTDFAVHGTGLAGFQGTQGMLNQGTQMYTLAQEPLKVRGTFHARLYQRPAGDSTHSADLRLIEGEFDVARPHELTTPQAAVPSPWWQTGLWFWAAGALTVIGIPLVIRRRNALVIDDVEWALLSGKLHRGARWAQRLVHRNPRDADALFLYGTALLKLNREDRLIEKVERLAAKLPREKRAGVAYTLAVAAKVTGDKRRLRRWAREAAREPLLRAKLHQEGVWTEPSRSGRVSGSRFLQTGYA